MANPGAAAKNAQKAAANAAEAAAQAGKGVPNKAAAIDWVKRADELGVDKYAAKQLDEDFIPQLEEAGVPKDDIKRALASKDPHAAAGELLASHRAAAEEVLRAALFTPEQMAGMSLKQLKDNALSLTDPDGFVGRRSAPSRIRGKDPNASQTVESRLPTEGVAQTAAPPMAETPSGDRVVYSDSVTREGPGFFTDSTKAPDATFRSDVISSSGIQRPTAIDIEAAEPPTPSMAELQKFIAGGDKAQDGGKKGKKAKSKSKEVVLNPDRAQVVTADVPAGGVDGTGAQYADKFVPAGSERVGVVEGRAGGAASPSVQPAPAPEVAPKGDAPLLGKDPIANAARGAYPWVKKQITERPLASAAVATVAVPSAVIAARYGGPIAGKALSHLYGAAFGDGGPAPAQGQQPQPGQQGPRPPVQINILPREALRQLEQPRRPQPAPMQAPAPQPGADRSTDIIRQLSGRMA